ncbi:MAG: hypothetical protein RQ872_01090 [Sulfolobaceae archaeon]|nr:hypothetical protein [Sulfolobaceae archaeon]
MITEGYFIKYDNNIWAVKGCTHPEGFVVAIPRVFKNKKIKKLNEALEIVRRYYPNLVKYVDEIGFEVPLIPLKESEVLDPFSKNVSNPLVKEFISYFKNVGVTGSLLYSNTFNDIDLITFYAENYRILKKLRESDITRPLEYVNKEEIETLKEEDFLNLKLQRVLEGVYKGTPYTFKIVECESFGVVERKKKFEGEVTITKELKPYSLPVKYLTDKGYILTSFRMRFTELKEGMRLYVKGLVLERDKFMDLDLDIAEEVKVTQYARP